MGSQDYQSVNRLSFGVNFEVETVVRESFEAMFKKKRDPTSLIEDAENEKPIRKLKKKRQKQKCENCKRCWGFCDFLKTSWKLFKEFSGNTSIHG